MGRAGFVQLTSSCPRPSLTGVRESEKELKQEPRGELKQRPWENPVTSLLSLSAQIATFYYPGPPAQRRHHPQWAGPFHINKQSRKYPMDKLIGQSDGGDFSVEVPSS